MNRRCLPSTDFLNMKTNCHHKVGGIMEGRDLSFWSKKLESVYNQLSQSEQYYEGYKLLYSQWSTIDAAEIVFLSLNPGKEGSSSLNKSLSDERGNSYVIEQYTTASPITEQYLRLADFLRVDPLSILCGVVNPFRSGSWQDLPNKMKVEGNKFGESFWSEIFKKNKVSLIVATGADAGEFVVNVKSADLANQILSGWGNIVIKEYIAKDGTKIVVLPHLSRFKLFSRKECLEALREIFGI